MMSMMSTSAGLWQPAGATSGHGQGAGPWVRLSRFRITVQQRDKIIAPVYANGFQQVPVLIELIAHDASGNEVQLSEQELNGLQLIGYEKSKLRSLNIAALNPIYEYGWKVENGGTPGAGDSEGGDTTKQGQTRTLYVSMTTIERVKVAAAITSTSGIQYATNTPNPGAGEFDSWIIVDGRYPIVHPWSDLVMHGPFDVIEMATMDVDMYYIAFKDDGLRIVFSEQFEGRSGEPFSSLPSGGWARKSFALFQPGDMQYAEFPAGIHTTINDRPGQACAARASTRGADSSPHLSHNGCINYFDQYGNMAPALVVVASDGDTMRLAPTGVHRDANEVLDDIW